LRGKYYGGNKKTTTGENRETEFPASGIEKCEVVKERKHKTPPNGGAQKRGKGWANRFFGRNTEKSKKMFPVKKRETKAEGQQNLWGSPKETIGTGLGKGKKVVVGKRGKNPQQTRKKKAQEKETTGELPNQAV